MAAEQAKINVSEIMERIRREAKEEIAKNPQSKRFIAPISSKHSLQEGQPLITSDELRYLNEHWHDWNAPSQIISHRKVLGPIIVRIKKFIADIIWNSFLRGYIEREREFQMRLVRYLNQNARYIDERDKAYFLNIVQKVDSDISATNERTDILCSEVLASTHQLESKLYQSPDLVKSRVHE